MFWLSVICAPFSKLKPTLTLFRNIAALNQAEVAKENFRLLDRWLVLESIISIFNSAKAPTCFFSTPSQVTPTHLCGMWMCACSELGNLTTWPSNVKTACLYCFFINIKATYNICNSTTVYPKLGIRNYYWELFLILIWNPPSQHNLAEPFLANLKFNFTTKHSFSFTLLPASHLPGCLDKKVEGARRVRTCLTLCR